MDIDAATKYAQEASTIVLLNVPSGSEFGIDMNVFYVGEKFKGIKMVPVGFHFVFFASVNSDGQSGPRTGFFYYGSRKSLIIKKWDQEHEGFCGKEIDKDQVERIAHNLDGDLDRFLGPYEFSTWKTWLKLTSYITEPVLDQLQPLSGIVNSVAQLRSPNKSTDQAPANHSLKEEDLLPEMEPLPGTMIRFTPLPSKKYPEGSSPSQITQHSIDSTYALEVLLSNYSDPEGILGEIQLAFVSFVLGQVYEGFEQWKNLICLMCKCDKGLSMYGDLFLSFINVLHFQLKEIPKDYLVDIVSKNNFLTASFQDFFNNVEETTHRELKKRAADFKKSLIKTHGWIFKDGEAEDCQPILVEME